MTLIEQQAYDEALRRIEECYSQGGGGTGISLKIPGMSILPPEIGQLTSLTYLDLSNNQLDTLPPEIGQLSSLTKLDLSYNELRSLPPEIGQLSSLSELDLSFNELIILPPEIGQLTSLAEFNVRENELSSLPPEIGQLSALLFLDLWNNQLSTLPSEIGLLSALKVLDLGGNRLRALPPEIGKLTALEGLFLGRNQLSKLPPEFDRLSALRELNLAANHLRALPTGIVQNSALRVLYLQENQLTTLPPEIGQLFALKKLVLANNQLHTLPPEIGQLSQLINLDLHDNPGLELPQEVLGPKWLEVNVKDVTPASPRAILDYYFARQAGGTKPLNEVKVILVGRGGAGKTSIRRRLIDNRFDPNQTETPGIEIDHWPMEGRGDGIEAHLWDFAGQDITHATHQFFLTKRSLYLLVLEGRSDSQDRDAEYWLRLIRAFGEDSPVLVLLNKWDAKPFPLQEFTLRREFPQIRGFIRTDCRTGLGLKELESTLLKTVRGMESVTQPFPTLWFRVKEKLADMTENYLPLCDYRRLCQANGVSDPRKQDSLAETLHTLGIILHYADDVRLHDTTVLNPRWVTASVYALLRHVEKRQADSSRFDGHLTLKEARAALPEERPQANADGTPLDMVAYLLGLMERFELCYPLEGKEQTWLIPQLLSPQNPPDLGEAWFTEPATRLRYLYTVLPEGLLPRFIVRAHPLVHRGQVWRQGVVLEMEDEGSGSSARALVIAEPGRERIEVTVTGPSAARLRLTKLVRAHFHDIHSSFSRTSQRDGKTIQTNSLDVRELVELEDLPGQFQSVKTLLVDEREHKISTIATEEAGSVRIDQTRELDRVASPEGKERQADGKEPTRKRPKVFLSYAHADAAYRDVFLQNLEVMEMDGLIASWHDGKVLASQDFDQEIRRAMEEADVILFLISTAALRSKYIREVEMARALERLEAGTKRDLPLKVVPILLEKDCAWKEGRLARLQMLPGDRSGNIKAVDQWPNRRKAFNAVEQALRKLLKNG